MVTYVSLPTTPTLSLTNPTPTGSANAAPPPNVIAVNPDLPSAYMNQWSFGVQREVWRGAGVELQYLGSHSLHLDRSYYNNTPVPGPGAVNPRRPNSLFTVIRTIQNDEIANYQSFSVVARQRLTHGIQFHTSYTWSHTLDVSTDSNGGGYPMNPYNWRADYSNANWDIRHRLTGAISYYVPSFTSHGRIMSAVLGKWQMNSLFTAQTGMPFNVVISPDRANTGVGNQRPDLVASPSSNCGGGHLTGCIVPSAFALPALYTYGTAGRNLLAGPGLFNIDYALTKDFPIKERMKLQFRAEFFNLLNHPNFSNPSSTFGTGSFGNITSTSTENRDIQFGLKLNF